MSRPLDEHSDRAPTTTSTERRIARSTARAFAAAISALLVSTFVVSRSDAALDAEGTTSGTTATSGTIALVDDDEGRSLFDLEDLAPGRPFERCIDVGYEGSILPVDLTLQATAEGDLAPYLDVTVEAGTGGRYDDCSGFVTTGAVFSGTLQQLTEADAVDVATLYNTGERRSFRVRFELADTNDALGRTTTAGFVWEVRPA